MLAPHNLSPFVHGPSLRFLGCISLEDGQIVDIYVDEEGPIVQFERRFVFYVETTNAERDAGWHPHFNKLPGVPETEREAFLENVLNFVRLYNDGSLTLRETD